MRLHVQNRMPVPSATALHLADTVHEIKGFEQGRWRRHRLVDAAAAFLEALEHRQAGREVTGCKYRVVRRGVPFKRR
jgi:hypothetical protein